jgi:acyl-CoA thioesterase 8
MPSVPSPNACVLVEDALEEKLHTTSGLTPELREIIQENIAERLMGPIAIKDAPLQRSSDGTLTHACWMRAKSIPRYELHFQKVPFLSKRILVSC